MKYIIVQAKDILGGYHTPYDDVAICNSIIINCDNIIRIETFSNKDKLNYTYDVIVLHTLDGNKFTIPDYIPIETNWDLIMCYHKKSTRIEL